MISQQFDQIINQSINCALSEGVKKGRMGTLDMVYILQNHAANLMSHVLQAQKMAQDQKAATEVIIPFTREIKPPQ